MLAGLGVGAMATPAQAAWADCPAGALCSYLNATGGGAPGTVYGDNSNLRGFTKFNLSRSVFNNGTQCHVRIYTGTGFTGDSYRMLRGSRIVNTKDFAGGQFSGGIGSNRWC